MRSLAITSRRRLAAVAAALALYPLAAGAAAETEPPARASSGYARPEMLVETAWVARHLRDPGIRVVDLRDAKAYEAGHIPGAVRLEEGPLRSAEDRLTYLPTAEALSAMMRRAGIGSRTHVVAYDDQGGRLAARLWYVLTVHGHPRVSLVNGGWLKWAAEKRPISTGSETPGGEAADFQPRRTLALSCSYPELLERRPGVVVLDARSPEEYEGTRLSGGAAKTGRVPGSVNVEWKENLTGPHLTLKPAAELRKLYEARGVTPDKEVVTYCASGGRASLSLFVLRLLGYPKVRLYYGSFGDYTARPSAPVAR